MLTNPARGRNFKRRRIAILPLRYKLYCENTDLPFAINAGLFFFPYPKQAILIAGAANLEIASSFTCQ
jgi:hypothetical protein